MKSSVVNPQIDRHEIIKNGVNFTNYFLQKLVPRHLPLYVAKINS